MKHSTAGTFRRIENNLHFYFQYTSELIDCRFGTLKTPSALNTHTIFEMNTTIIYVFENIVCKTD